MNKYQEALIKLVAHNYSTRSEKNEYINTLQELVNEKTPMKVDKNTKGTFPNYDKDDTYHTTYKCPKCNCTIHLDWHEQRNFCPECAVKLDWSDTDEYQRKIKTI